MVIKNEIINVLRTFCGIHPGIIIYPGNQINTKNEEGDIAASYVVDQEFDNQICIYDLSRFLNTIKIVGENSTLSINNNTLEIKSSDGKNSVEYAMTPEAMVIRKPMKDRPAEFDEKVVFELTSEAMKKIRQASSALGVQHLSITESNGSIIARVHQLQTDTSRITEDFFEFELCAPEQGTSENCCFVFDIDSLPSYDGNYRVSVSDDGRFSMFRNNEIDLTFWASLREETVVN